MNTVVKRFNINNNFVWLWSASAISNLGDGILLAAVPLLAASITRDPLLVAGVTVATRLPWLLFPLVSGALADRLDRRYAMLGTDLFRAAMLACLVWLILYEGLTMTHLYAFVFLLGAAETLFDMSAEAIVPSIVEPGQLVDANSRLMSTELLLNQLVGTALGGLLFAILPFLPFAVDAASFLVSAILLLIISGSFRPILGPHEKSPNLGKAILEGIGWLWHHRTLRIFAVVAGLVNFSASGILATLVLFVQEVLELGASAYGLFLAVGAVGGLLGSIVATPLGSKVGSGIAIIVSQVLIMGAAFTAILTTNPYLLALLLACAMAGVFIWNVTVVSFRQRVVPNVLLGRVSSVSKLISWGAMPLGAMAGGFVATIYGLRAPFAMGAIATTIGLLLVVVKVDIAALEL